MQEHHHETQSALHERKKSQQDRFLENSSYDHTWNHEKRMRRLRRHFRRINIFTCMDIRQLGCDRTIKRRNGSFFGERGKSRHNAHGLDSE